MKRKEMNKIERIVVCVAHVKGCGQKEMSALGKELAWLALEELTGKDRQSLESEGILFAKRKSGQPFWQGSTAHLSITHTKDTSATAVADVAAAAAYCGVGIDMEAADRESLRAAKRMFSKAEQQWMEQQKASGENHAFAKLWTLREAYAKWTGEGLAGLSKRPEVEFKIAKETVQCSDDSCQAAQILLQMDKTQEESGKMILSVVIDKNTLPTDVGKKLLPTDVSKKLLPTVIDKRAENQVILEVITADGKYFKNIGKNT